MDHLMDEARSAEPLESLLAAACRVAYGRFDRDGVLLLANPSLLALIGDATGDVLLPDIVVAGQRDAMRRILSGDGVADQPLNVHVATAEQAPTTLLLTWKWDGDELVVLGEPPVADLDGALAGLTRLNSRVSVLARDSVKTTSRTLGELAAANQELGAANHELEDFAYSIAHDLRSPLRALDGFSLAVLEDYGDRLDPTGRDYLERIRAASQHLAELFDAQLAVAQTGRHPVKIGEVDLTALARRVIERLRAEAPSRRVVSTVAEGLTARTDAVLAELVLERLLDNAWKFTSRNDVAHVEVGGEERDGELVFYVRDDGVGFDAADAGRLFAPFECLHRDAEFPGLGIGLVGVRRMLAKLGARCWAEGEVDRGAVVWFTLTRGS